MKISTLANQLGVSKTTISNAVKDLGIELAKSDTHKQALDISQEQAKEIKEYILNRKETANDHVMTANEPQINSKEVQTTALIETLRFLEEQIREKDKQIQEKDDQISDLIESLQNEQKLNAMNQNKILELEEKGKKNEAVEQEEKKKGVFRRFFGF